MVQDTETLIKRADAAIAEAQRLIGINLAWRDQTAAALDWIFLAVSSYPFGSPRYPLEYVDPPQTVTAELEPAGDK